MKTKQTKPIKCDYYNSTCVDSTKPLIKFVDQYFIYGRLIKTTVEQDQSFTIKLFLN